MQRGVRARERCRASLKGTARRSARERCRAGLVVVLRVPGLQARRLPWILADARLLSHRNGGTRNRLRVLRSNVCAETLHLSVVVTYTVLTPCQATNLKFA